MVDYFDGKTFTEPGKLPVETEEGGAAVIEAIKFIESLAPIKPSPKLRRLDEDEKIPVIRKALESNDKLVQICKDHVLDMGPAGKVGFIGTDDSTPASRLGKYGYDIEEYGES